MNYRQAIITTAILLFLLLPAAAWALTYATINEVTPSQLTNAVQITVKADGTLDWRPDGRGDWWGNEWSGRAGRIGIRFSNARSSVKNFIDVGTYPVSHIQTAVPQDAEDGIGVVLQVGLFTECEFTVRGTTDRQSVIITVKSKRTLETNNQSSTGKVDTAQVELCCDCEDGKLSVQALKADMLKVFGEIARVSGVNILVDDAVQKRTVSMSLMKMPPEYVLQAIASAYGLAIGKKGDVYMVSEGVPTDLATYRLSGTQSFPMKYVRAQTASGLLPTFLYSYLHVNNEQNAVVVSAPNQMLDKIKTDLAKVDIAPPQIMIEALAIEVSGNDDLLLALRANGQSGSGQYSLDTVAGDVSYSTVGKLPNEFFVNLKALVAQNRAKIHANPRMAVVNGHVADIFIGAQRFIRVEYNQYGQVSEKIQGVDVGTKISVTPWTGGNGEITTTIAPEVSNIVELERRTGLPTLSSRRASTTVRVKDGETIVIGGLTQKQYYDTRRRIPILGDIPIVGNLFKSRDKTSIDAQLIILITPRILSESGHLPSEEEAKIKDRVLK